MIEIEKDYARTLTIAAVCDTVDFCSSDLTCETANRVAKRTLPIHLSHPNIRFHLAILLLRPVTWKLWKFLCQNLFRRQAITVNLTKSKINVPSPRCHWLHARVRWSSMPQLIARWRDQWSTCLFDPSKSPIFLFELSFFFPKTIPASLDCHSVARDEHEFFLSKMGCPGGKTCRIELFQVGTTRQQGQSKTSLPRHYRSRVFPKQVARRILFTKSREFS